MYESGTRRMVFVGANWSMGLRHGKAYTVSTRTGYWDGRKMIIASIRTFWSLKEIPYESPASFMRNWKHV